MKIKIENKINIYYILSILYGISLTIFGAISYVYLVQSGFRYEQIGIYLSTFWIITMIFEIPTGIMVDIYKHKITLLISNIIRIIGILLLAFNYANMSILLISATLTGFSEAILSGNLTSWIVKEVNKSGIDIKLNVIFSRMSVLSTIFGLISGYVGSEFLYKYDLRLPFIISVLIFIINSVLIIIFFKKENINNEDKENSILKIENEYIEVLKQVKQTIFRKELYYFLTFYLIIDLINLGPSEQWQEVYKQNLGIIWVFIGLSGIIGNYIPSKINVNKISIKRNLIIFLIFDTLIVFVQSVSSNFLPMFFIHIIIYSLLSIVLNTYKHSKLIKNDNIRTTVVSVLNTFDSMIMTILLSINGILSTRIGILNAWKIFLIISILFIFIISIWKEPQYDR